MTDLHAEVHRVNSSALVTLTCRCGKTATFSLSEILTKMRTYDRNDWLVVSMGLNKEVGVICPEHRAQ